MGLGYSSGCSLALCESRPLLQCVECQHQRQCQQQQRVQRVSLRPDCVIFWPNGHPVRMVRQTQETQGAEIPGVKPKQHLYDARDSEEPDSAETCRKRESEYKIEPERPYNGV